ncbi:MAG: hypothetical protein M1818_006589 [Claussenomyces sp. TS43310]|nr:MAG: hypothetical protein M1818_006589 [Claussenomyces sp. TS43310]
MTQPGSTRNGGGPGGLDSLGQGGSGIQRGSRRQKLAGYLKAANELRQSYQQSRSTPWGSGEGDEGDELPAIPGAFPDVSIATHRDEQLVLFPSYCKRHIKEAPRVPLRRDSREQNNTSEVINDAEFWKREWEKHEHDKAVVEVDVRGWLYSPHRGPMNRKNRLLIGLARQLSGLPAPKPDNSKSRGSSPEHHSIRARHEAEEARREQAKIAREAEEILRKGQGEEAIAAHGGYSEQPQYDSDSESIYSDDRGRRGHGSQPPQNNEPPGPGHLTARASWNHPADMSPSELAAANSNLMARLMPFLTNPIVSTPISLFFYDSQTSQSKTVMTNEAGHFTIRAALDFVPTHVRVLASENLSATAEIKITEPRGVSLISDVDDTIKHSSIGSGAREIFRNTFIRDLRDLTIDGIKEWYNSMYDMGVGIHYVSNSPWQLFPVLVSYFQKAQLPPGSYHLKQYSGMLQGIFEPVAERKKGTLERIMRDFPERRFLLVGDSGEADLEVYTDVALANPGRVIGVFIRDVTTPPNQGFFDSTNHVDDTDTERRRSRPARRGWSEESKRSARSSISDASESRPPLPNRILTETTPQTSEGPAMGKLIDFDEEPEEMSVHESHARVLPRSHSDLEQLESFRIDASSSRRAKMPPPPRPKPLALRSTAAGSSLSVSSRGPPPPPPPPRSNQKESFAVNHPLAQTQNTSELSPKNDSYMSVARDKVASAYNAIPPASSYLPGITQARTEPPPQSNPEARPRPIPPPRRSITATAAAYASNRLSWNNNSRTNLADGSDDEGSPTALPSLPREPVNKKLDLWRRRWRRARDILDAHGVELRSWHTGYDVASDAVQLVEKHLRELGVEGYGANGTGKGKTGQGGGEVKVKDLKT